MRVVVGRMVVIVCGTVGMGHLCDASTWTGFVEVRQGPSAETWGGTWLDCVSALRECVASALRQEVLACQLRRRRWRSEVLEGAVGGPAGKAAAVAVDAGVSSAAAQASG